MNATKEITGHCDTPNPGDWATLTDAGAALQLSRSQVWRLVQDGLLTAHTFGEAPTGRVTLFWRAELAELAEARRRAGKGKG